METHYEHAIVRPPGEAYAQCIRPPGARDEIDVALAAAQHSAYVRALESQGIRIHSLAPDAHYPDGCFVEDAVIVAEDLAIICAMGAPARRGEETSVGDALKQHVEIARITPPAEIDGGDVVRIGNRLFVGVSQRTNRHALDQLRDIVEPRGGEVVAVEMNGVLHLKSACTYAGNDTVVISPEHVDKETFAGCRRIEVPLRESYAANCLAVNGMVVVSVGYPRTRDLLDKSGFKTMELEMSEFRKGWGSLTCLSVLF
ncbi:MAG: hypothetical protein IH969_04640 [Candidatus Krumholzibacteriota bacterium]|nr:hypothetical protein [Candidatus Krumholzibacteriota bacterium]